MNSESVRRTLLQIEDNPANAELLEQLIARRSDLKFHTAVNADQGMEMAGSYQPDLILMDMKMPGISGLAAISLLRANPATANIPVIALSSNAYSSEIKRCLEAGAIRYLTKPYRIDALMTAIDEALNSEKEIELTTSR